MVTYFVHKLHVCAGRFPCFSCRGMVEVHGLARRCRECAEFYWLPFITKISLRELRDISANLYFDRDPETPFPYLMNHCPECDARIRDSKLYGRDGVFSSLSNQEIAEKATILHRTVEVCLARHEEPANPLP